MAATITGRRIAQVVAAVVVAVAAGWTPVPAQAHSAPAQPLPTVPAPLTDDWYTQWKNTTADPGAPVKETRPKLTWRSDQDVLWRGSNRTPEVIFADGLRPQGEKTPEDQRQYNWVSQVDRSTPETVFSGASRDQSVAVDFGAWIYEVHAPWGIDQEASGTYTTMFGLYRGEQEITFPGGIKSRFIKDACPRDGGACQSNPNYDPSGADQPQDVAAVTIDWARLWPTQDAGALPWVSEEGTAWAVGTDTLNPFQGEDAFREGLKPRVGTAPWLGLFKEHVLNKPTPSVLEHGWEALAVGAAVPGFRAKSDAEELVSEAKAGGWVYQLLDTAHGFRTDLLNKPTKETAPAEPVELGYVGGVRGGLLLTACHYPQGSTVSDQCFKNPHPGTNATTNTNTHVVAPLDPALAR
ncbi:hypothetical protein [Kitasatospora sp. MY 5-36]|uniref:scabin-related ADP-ribosyltransferase n=1 Tax=Kitasatospora sp. MY 5-36 TaxID=1678027 RepID=UPI000670BE79|nr:hypothetical protein [Kitasatospora sp. MY 5-36]